MVRIIDSIICRKKRNSKNYEIAIPSTMINLTFNSISWNFVEIGSPYQIIKERILFISNLSKKFRVNNLEEVWQFFLIRWSRIVWRRVYWTLDIELEINSPINISKYHPSIIARYAKTGMDHLHLFKKGDYLRSWNDKPAS